MSSRHWVPGVGWRPGPDRRGPTPARKKGGRPPKTVTGGDAAAGRKLPSAPPAKKLRSQAAYGAVPEVPLPIEGRAPKLPASRGPGDGVGKGAVLRVFFEGFGWATGHVQKVTRDGAVTCSGCRTLPTRRSRAPSPRHTSCCRRSSPRRCTLWRRRTASSGAGGSEFFAGARVEPAMRSPFYSLHLSSKSFTVAC